MDLVISSISQGILWGVLSLGLFISFRILNIADMTTEGSFPLGAATLCHFVSTRGEPILSNACGDDCRSACWWSHSVSYDRM